MANFSGKYFKVWKVEPQEKYVKMDISEGKKDRDGNWSNWSWFGTRFVGQCKDLALEVNVGDTIEVTNGLIEQYKKKDGGWGTQVVVFEFDIVNRQTQQEQEESDDLPY